MIPGSSAFEPLSSCSDAEPMVLPMSEITQGIFQYFGDNTPKGTYFWRAWYDSDGGNKKDYAIKEEFCKLWNIEYLMSIGKFDLEEMIVYDMEVDVLEPIGDGFYVTDVFISTPELNERLKALVKKAKADEKRRKEQKKQSKETRAKPGCSNAGKYPDVPSDMFCGPAGGACEGTYPVNTPGRWRAAKSYARHAPDPQGIKDCADRIAREQGWLE